MKFYIAVRTAQKKLVSRFSDLLEKYQNENVYNWTKKEMKLPYSEHEKESTKYADEIIKKLDDLDLFILLSDKNGTDMFIEMGSVLKDFQKNGKPKIYAIGKYANRSLLHFHSSISRLNNLEELLQKEFPEIKYDGLDLRLEK